MIRKTGFTIAAVVCATLGFTMFASAQTAAVPTIYNVTLDDTSGVLTISGVGFDQNTAVSVDGQPVTVLQGGTTRQLQILAPAALLLAPGSYRLTVEDQIRHVGDAFAVTAGGHRLVATGAVSDGSGAMPRQVSATPSTT